MISGYHTEAAQMQNISVTAERSDSALLKHREVNKMFKTNKAASFTRYLHFAYSILLGFGYMLSNIIGA